VTRQPSIAVANNTFICAFMAQFYSARCEWKLKIRQKNERQIFSSLAFVGVQSRAAGLFRGRTLKPLSLPTSFLGLLDEN